MINPDLQVGQWLNVRHNKGWIWKTIRHILGSWGDHNAPILEENGEMMIGDAKPGGARTTTIKEYQDGIASGEIEVRVYDIPYVSFAERHWASSWWLTNVKGKPYDYLAYPRLFLKAIFGDWIPFAAGFEWAWWCTESCRAMYIEPVEITREIDPLGNNNPTPRTAENRLSSGDLVYVTDKLTIK